jgi:hypothetical protein
LIAQIVQQLQPIIEIEKAWLPPHAFAPNPSNPMESEMPPIDQVFRTAILLADPAAARKKNLPAGIISASQCSPGT